jgi:AcrR family transcriptional regulator
MAWADTSGARQRPGKVAILRAAVSVMGEDGYEGASMREMAARAGVSVAAIYYHFPSKHDLLREFLDDSWRIALDRIDRRLRNVENTPTARLDEIVATVIASQNHDEFAQLASVVAMREHTRLNPPERAAIEQQQQRLLDLVERTVADGVGSGDFTTSEPAEAARAILAVTSSFALLRPVAARPMREIIPLAQRFARAISCA